MRLSSLVVVALLGCSSGGDDGGVADAGPTDDAAIDSAADATDDTPVETITATPKAIDDILVNPGMGFADFALGWGGTSPADTYPTPSVGYVRWSWAEVEPTEGAYAFDMVDAKIAEARKRGETFAFRIMPSYGPSTPKWLLDKGVGSVATSDGSFPDHNAAPFLAYHAKLVQAFGARYAGKPEIDHVDIGSVGCWGEWNTACCEGAAVDTCNKYFPTETNQKAVIDLYAKAFAGTPLVALVGAPVPYAVSKGAGWRGDCFGDYGMFSATWNHMVNVYDPVAKDPATADAWQKAPVQFEACGVMKDWHDKGFDIDLILQKGLDWHLSVFNGKSSAVPSDWRPKVDAWLKKIGYRLVLQSLTHAKRVAPGASLSIAAKWSNVGIAPPYHRWPIAFRLRDPAGKTLVSANDPVDLRTFTPGVHDGSTTLAVPADAAAGDDELDVAVLSEDGAAPFVRLAIEGARSDGWYAVSRVTITR